MTNEEIADFVAALKHVDSPRCPSCGTPLLAVKRDQLLAHLPPAPPGWTLFRNHEHGLWASIRYYHKQFDGVYWLTRTITVHMVGSTPTLHSYLGIPGGDLPAGQPGQVKVTYLTVDGPPNKRRESVADQWAYAETDVTSIAAKVKELLAGTVSTKRTNTMEKQ
jgi:hypothetical protein